MKRYFRKWSPAQPDLADDLDPMNEYYLTCAPSPQTALDIFAGEWYSKFPPPLDILRAGTIDLFEDDRIKWLVSELGDLEGQHVLELGPLEGGHSYMLDLSGAGSVTAIEANTRAYLKCLIAKEVLGMRRVRFLCGDSVEYMKGPDCQQFDIGVASGILYHMANPVELLSLLSKSCRTHLFLWTHYYDEAWAEARDFQGRFPFAQRDEYAGFPHTLVRQCYENADVAQSSFCGGSRPYSNWMLRAEIIKCLEYFGFSSIRINFDQPDHPNGPAFALLASRT